MSKLQGKTAIVTGASKGISFAFFAVLVQRDACSRRCCASASHCAIFSSFAA